MSTHKTIIVTTTIRYACVYQACPVRAVYYVLADAADFPVEVTRLPNRIRLFQGREVIEVKSGTISPLVVEAPKNGCSLNTTLNCARNANIRPDALFEGTRVRLAIEPSLGYVRAIEVNVDQMVKRYDDLCAEFFTGG